MTIELPNGATLITNDNWEGQRIIVIIKGMSIGAEILPANEETQGTDAWANREIELYEQALEIDLQSHKDFIKQCLSSNESSNKIV